MMLRPLQPGDRIALVAPSSPFELSKFEEARRFLEAQDFAVAPGRHIFCRNGYLAGSEAERSEDLIHALCDPTVSAVLCVRGGYGSSRLVPWLPFSRLQQHPKIFLGYSDVTFLHAAFQKHMGWTTFHGPNLVSMADTPQQRDEVLRALSGASPFSWNLDEAQILTHGTTTGVLLGGNLTCFAHLLGTDYLPDCRGALLLIEDRGEAPYRLDRLLTHLKLAGILPQLGGLILGQFTGCGEAEGVLRMVHGQVRQYGYPVVAGLPFGHGVDNEVIPLGAPFTLNTREKAFQVQRSPFLSRR